MAAQSPDSHPPPPAQPETEPWLAAGDMAADKKPDAGMREYDHYVRTLPRWRYRLREAAIPIVRYETPLLERLQAACRTPLLDSYFAFTANLGTHTFFMIMLPVLIWCGHMEVGMALTQILAAGVFFSGFIKDFYCLPRPLSPPLRRITMSGSAALEYGFPSTHSTNAVSVVIYFCWLLYSGSRAGSVSDTYAMVGYVAAVVYGVSISFGRLYCGMHGFLDVGAGSLLGAAIGIGQVVYGDAFADWVRASDSAVPILTLCAVIIVLIRIHPEPADDCPCFDDSVAFAGVMMGLEAGAWNLVSLASRGPSWYTALKQAGVTVGAASGGAGRMAVLSQGAYADASTPGSLGALTILARILLGVVIVFLWRALMKTTLLTILPPIYRVIEYLGIVLTRRFFVRASQYRTVDIEHERDNVIPPASDIPQMVGEVIKRRGRQVSVGPQSVADMHEKMQVFGDAKAGEGGAGAAARREVSELYPEVQKPRVRYDVEVVTKLIVYFGIAWLAVEGNPLLFQAIGLGSGIQSV